MINIYEQSQYSPRKTVIATAPTFEEAKAKVEAMGVSFMEDDSDYPGCADAYMNDGRIIVIQPEGFKL
jgi:G:T-mismatch repair DNA endonuclease (very short patch repair protein)